MDEYYLYEIFENFNDINRIEEGGDVFILEALLASKINHI